MTRAPVTQVSDLVALIAIVLFGSAIMNLGAIAAYFLGDIQ
jgi:hypothetical protein